MLCYYMSTHCNVENHSKVYPMSPRIVDELVNWFILSISNACNCRAAIFLAPIYPPRQLHPHFVGLAGTQVQAIIPSTKIRANLFIVSLLINVYFTSSPPMSHQVSFYHPQKSVWFVEYLPPKPLKLFSL